jgi:CDP-diacylglycerol--glycerol-3-phosphate 3-phosphatidyltransferase/cardiolipin synthase
VIKAETGGKLKVGAQITAIIALILADWRLFGLDFYDIGIVAIWVSIALSIASGFQYLVSFWKTITSQGASGA